MLFDTHAHLTDSRFDDIDEVLDRAYDAGVRSVFLATADVDESLRSVALIGKHASHRLNLYCSVGVHPHEAKSFDLDSELALRNLLDASVENRIVAVGEIGLDYHYDLSPRETQRDVFKSQLEIAADYKLPVIIHEREATKDTLDILIDFFGAGASEDRGVIHCFSGSVETARILVKMGFCIGFDGPVTFKNNRHAPEIIASVPIDKILIETDSPYLTPVPHRGKRNEPAYVRYVLEKVAEIKGLSPDKMADVTYNNALRLFRISPQLPFKEP